MKKNIVSIWKTAVLVLVCLLAITSCTDNRQKLEKKEAEIAALYNKSADEENRIKTDEKLTQWLMTDSTTLSYDFPSLTADYGMLRAASDDGKVAILSWTTGYFSYRTVIQIKDEDGFHTYDKGLIQLASGKNDERYEGGSLTTQIHALEADNGETYYLAHSFGNPTSAYSSHLHQWTVFKIEDGCLVPLKGQFVDEEKGTVRDNIQQHIHLSAWNAMTRVAMNTDTWKLYLDWWVLWIPLLDEEECMTDRYHAYYFSGEHFIKYIEERANPYLIEELEEYESLVQLYKADDLFVRIDRMKDGTYRYASWREWDMKGGPLDMELRPDIIITGGTYDLEAHTYRFRNGHYCYNVPEMKYEGERIIHAHPVHPDITVTYKGKLLSKFTIEY